MDLFAPFRKEAVSVKGTSVGAEINRQHRVIRSALDGVAKEGTVSFGGGLYDIEVRFEHIDTGMTVRRTLAVEAVGDSPSMIAFAVDCDALGRIYKEAADQERS